MYVALTAHAFINDNSIFNRAPRELYFKKELKDSVQYNAVLTLLPQIASSSNTPHSSTSQVCFGETKICCLVCKDVFGEAPLHKAARVGSMECLSLLVASDAQIE